MSDQINETCNAFMVCENALLEEPMLLEEMCVVVGNFLEDKKFKSLRQTSRAMVRLGLVKPSSKPIIDFYLDGLFSGSNSRQFVEYQWEANFGEPLTPAEKAYQENLTWREQEAKNPRNFPCNWM